jgi:hypothetical protein
VAAKVEAGKHFADSEVPTLLVAEAVQSMNFAFEPEVAVVASGEPFGPLVLVMEVSKAGRTGMELPLEAGAPLAQLLSGFLAGLKASAQASVAERVCLETIQIALRGRRPMQAEQEQPRAEKTQALMPPEDSSTAEAPKHHPQIRQPEIFLQELSMQDVECWLGRFPWSPLA